MSNETTAPAIQLKGSNLYIGQHIVTLHGRNKTRLLMAAMVEAHRQEEGIKRDHLRREVYEARGAAAVLPSNRLRESQDGSLSKLISRSRRFLVESLRETPWSSELDWFVYSEKERSWQLVQKRKSA